MGGARVTVAVALGSALGAVARWIVSVGTLAALGPGIAWATLAANVLGSFLIGLYAGLTAPGGRIAASEVQTAFVAGGFCSGFTTFSIFSLETLTLAETQGWPAATGLAVASAAAWLVAVAAGYRLGRGPARPGA